MRKYISYIFITYLWAMFAWSYFDDPDPRKMLFRLGIVTFLSFLGLVQMGK